MFKSRTPLQKRVGMLLFLVGFIAIAGFVINRGSVMFGSGSAETLFNQGGEHSLVPAAIAQTNEPFQNSEDFQALASANRAFIALVAKTRPSVVKIQTARAINFRAPDRDDNFFRFFFDSPPPRRDEERRQFQRGTGSGVIVSDDGYILTNNHVIEGANEITVVLSNEREYKAELIGRDPAGSGAGGSDLAVLKIKAEGLPALPFGDSDALEVGEWVIAIGTPLELSQTVTRGIVSSKDRRGFTQRDYAQFIQTDAPINRGNSGGALINIRGELVGINTLIATSGFTTGNIGIGFAIPSNMARSIMPQLIENGKVVRGWLGISMSPVDFDLAEKLNMESPHGAQVTQVGKGSPAEKGGIRRGDVIIEFNGVKIRNFGHLKHVVGAAGVGKSVYVTVLRAGKEKRLTIKLGKRTEAVLETLEDSQEVVPDMGEPQTDFAGLRVQALTPAFIERYGYAPDETGVIVTHVEKESNAQKKGITPGTLIQEMEYTPIDNLEAYSALARRLAESEEKRILLYVKFPNGEGAGYVTLNLAQGEEKSDR